MEEHWYESPKDIAKALVETNLKDREENNVRSKKTRCEIRSAEGVYIDGFFLVKQRV
jgi:hypothetical protein